jgi:hypothetical protein
VLEYDWNITGILLDILMGSWKSRLDITWIRFGAIGADCSKVPVQVNSGAARREGEQGEGVFDAKGLAVQPMVYSSLS